MVIPVTLMVVSLAFAVVATLLMARGGPRNGLLVVAAAFLVFAYGPAINILVGDIYYFGINASRIATPLLGFGLALAGILLAHQVIPQQFDQGPVRTTRDYLLLQPLLLACAGYGGVAVVQLGGGVGANKLEQVAAAGAFHYPYLLLQILVVSTYFICRAPLSRKLWTLNFVIYVLYALVTSERDFLFVAAAVLVHREVFLDQRRNMRAVTLATVLAVAGTLLATGRQATGRGSILSSVLNQGSILFVDSQLHDRLPEPFAYRHGETYLQALGRPFGLTDESPLADWFVSWYAPGSSSGYGFSLTGEAALNFGLWGVPVVFFLLALVQRWLMNRISRSDLSCYLSVVFLATWLYALRGDFAQIFATMLYAIALFSVLSLVRVDVTRFDRSRRLISPAQRSYGGVVNDNAVLVKGSGKGSRDQDDQADYRHSQEIDRVQLRRRRNGAIVSARRSPER